MSITYGDGKAGQFAKSRAQKQLERTGTLLALFAAVPSMILGVWMGYMMAHQLALRYEWARHVTPSTLFWIPLTGMVVLLILLSLSLRLLRRPLNYLMRERLHWLRGGQAEALIAMLLRDLDDEWHLFNNVELKTGGDLDHVLIGPAGIFCISTKAHKGTYARASDGSFLLNGQPTAEILDAQKLALKLRNWLEVKLHDVKDAPKVPWVQPILVAPFARIEFPSRLEIAWVVDDDALMDIMNELPKRLDRSSVAANVSVLQAMTRRAPTVRSRNAMKC